MTEALRQEHAAGEFRRPRTNWQLKFEIYENAVPGQDFQNACVVLQALSSDNRCQGFRTVCV
jgi:hypothetical protein